VLFLLNIRKSESPNVQMSDSPKSLLLAPNVRQSERPKIRKSDSPNVRQSDSPKSSLCENKFRSQQLLLHDNSNWHF
jgi:hypothetical protein